MADKPGRQRPHSENNLRSVTMLKIVNDKKGSDGNSIDRSSKNCCLTDVEILYLLQLLEGQSRPFDRQGFSDFSLEHELQSALDHSDTQFE